jgi:selenoprotein W-related protein
VPSGGGVFEVDVDGERIFSKRELGRFPEEGEVLGTVQGRLGAAAAS